MNKDKFVVVWFYGELINSVRGPFDDIEKAQAYAKKLEDANRIGYRRSEFQVRLLVEPL